MRVAWLFLFVVGCAGSRAVIPATPVRDSLRGGADGIVAKNARGDGWQPTQVSGTLAGLASADERWSQTTMTVTFVAKPDAGDPRLLTVEEMAAVLKGVRRDVRKAIQNAGGEVAETTDGEGYHERWFVTFYRTGDVVGRVRGSIGPASERPGETACQVVFALHEQASD